MTTKYRPINGFTKQRIKDVLSGIKKQSLGPNGVTCAYRGEDGAKCAVGAFIPDELYDPYMEGTKGEAYLVRELLAKFPTLAPHMPLSVDALTCLQSVHDSSAFTSLGTVDKQLLDWVETHVEDDQLSFEFGGEV